MTTKTKTSKEADAILKLQAANLTLQTRGDLWRRIVHKLEPYAKHDAGCPKNSKCDCGLREVRGLIRVAEAKEQL